MTLTVSRPPVVQARRVTLAGFQLCEGCTNALTQAVAGIREKVRPCASCRAAVRTRLQWDRRGP